MKKSVKKLGREASACRGYRKSLLERFDELYEQFGYYEDRAVSRSFPGEAGAEKMRGIMAGLREHGLASLGGRRVERIRDVQRSVSFDPACPSEQAPLSLPKSDVLQFFLEGGTTVSARPSGTEPKIKFYINCAVPAAGLCGDEGGRGGAVRGDSGENQPDSGIRAGDSRRKG
ncbi:hypothetical protein [Treponema endosymbiont of Eucomonympha sp.]|uniref:hypothetical protein n=1 Tax=Treponema endosymbiont of Eucomonympha sp. TaxID=1580831 RepID=UPI000750F48A|nr:hypothetical protein [Treponema endosymbiont of Eucomonympha sp.]